MSERRRIHPLLIFAGFLAIEGLLFGPWVLEKLLKPLASGLWLLLRVTLLGIDQSLLWAIVVLSLFGLLALGLVLAPRLRPEAPAEPAPDTASSDLEYWRYLFAEPPRDSRERFLAQRELARLLCAAYAARNRVQRDFGLFSAFKDGRIPLPERVHALLFDEAADSRPRPSARIEAWLRRVTGRDKADYKREIEEFLEYLETQMEMRDERR